MDSTPAPNNKLQGSVFYLCRKGPRVIQTSPARGTRPRPPPAVLLWLPAPPRGSQTCCSSCRVARQTPEKETHTGKLANGGGEMAGNKILKDGA